MYVITIAQLKKKFFVVYVITIARLKFFVIVCVMTITICATIAQVKKKCYSLGNETIGED